MPRALARFAAVTLLATSLTACGGGDDPVAPPPTPTASIALGASTAAVVAGATTPVAVTLTRGGGFAGAVTVTATGLPTGVTASSESIAAGATTATITVTAAANAPAASAASVNITGTGSAVTIAPQPLALNVTPAAGASIALSSASGSVPAGSNATVTVTLTRTGGFTGSVVIAAPSVPTGVTVASQTIASGATTATLTIATTGAAAVTTTALTITGTASGVTIAPQPYALTVTAAPSPISQIGSDITSPDGNFAARMALSANGNRLVVSAYTTANGTTRVYERSGSTWVQLGADIIGEASADRAGSSVDINAAGTRIAVGAIFNDNGSIQSSGHVRVYDLVGSTWTQVGGDIDGVTLGQQSGWSVALSGSGSRVIVGSSGGNGSARVYDLVGQSWMQVGADLSVGADIFGYAVDVSSDGTTIAIGAPTPEFNARPGSVYVYRLVGATWTSVGSPIVGTINGEQFGTSLSLSANGSRVAISAPSNSEGGLDGGGNGAGQVRVFEFTGGAWSALGSKITGGTNGEFGIGFNVRLSDDGTRVATTVVGLSTAFVSTLSSGTWVRTGTTPAPAASARSEGLALSADGSTTAVGTINGSPRKARVFSITP